jgi:rubrerythrin
MTTIKMPKLVWVQCADCGEVDQVYWGAYGATDVCPVCKAPAAALFKVEK